MELVEGLEGLESLVLSGSLSSLRPASFGLFCLLGLWSLPLVSFSVPFLGAFFLKSLAGFLLLDYIRCKCFSAIVHLKPAIKFWTVDG
jgi:hypothetical protein